MTTTTISDSPEWIDHIYEVQRADRVLGGEEGAINRQAQELANRTKYLREQLAVISRLAGSYGTLAATLKTRLDKLEGLTEDGPTDPTMGLPSQIGISTGAVDLVRVMAAKGEVVLPVNEAQFFDVTLTQPNCVLRLDPYLRVTDRPIKRHVDILLRQGSGSNKLTFTGAIRWAYQRPPVLSYERGYADLVTLETINNGDTWIGHFVGGWVNV